MSKEQNNLVTGARLDRATTLPVSAANDCAIQFGEFQLVPTTRTLTRNGARVRLGGRALDILITLVERAGQVVSKAELFAIVWQSSFIEDSNLRVHIAQLRKALGDPSGSGLVMSVPRRGYTFVAQTKRIIIGANGLQESDTASDRNFAPAALIKIIGRDEIVSDVADQLRRERLLTITGAGGIGKSALALAVSQKICSRFRDGVLLVDLALLGGLKGVTTDLVSLLRLPDPDTPPLQSLVMHLRTRSMLIVFDNCEHVIEAISAIAEAILQGAPEVHILATSRERLRLRAERVQRLGPLAVPAISTELTAAEVLRFPAVQLFVERALAADGTFELTDIDAPIVAQICTRLDGLPFALELAATNVPLFGLCGVAARLDGRFDVLTNGHRTALPRHRTLRALIDWSYETLNEDEKIVWRRFSVFPGPFTIEAADAIANDRSHEDLNVIDILGRLVEKSLVSVEVSGTDTKYRLPETLQLYALNKLLEAKEAESVRRSYVSHLREAGSAACRNSSWKHRSGDSLFPRAIS